MKQLVVDTHDITKVYQVGTIAVHALRGLSLEIFKGEVVAIMGPSGSGKSTLMNIIGALDQPTSGEYYLDGQNVANLNEDQLAKVRNKQVGFVFQSFNLLSMATALANVELPLRYSRNVKGKRRQIAKEALERVGLGDRLSHRPNELSGGEQQRVAIARAIVNSPSIIMADEPTGNLDTKTGDEVMDLLLTLNAEENTTLIIITHDPEIAESAQRTIYIRDGLLEV